MQFFLGNIIIADAYYNCKILQTLSKFAIFFCSYFLQYLLCNMIIATAYYNCKVLRTLSKFAILCYYFLQFLLGTYNLQAKYCKLWVRSLQYFEYLCITLHNCIKYCMTYLQSIAFLWISLHYFAPLHSVLHNIIA